MKVALFVVVALALVAAACAQDATPQPRWGKFRIHRLEAKLAEFASDITEAKSEVGIAKAWSTAVCKLTHGLWRRRIQRAEATLQEWRQLRNKRAGQGQYHNARHQVHHVSHQYAENGPASLQAALQGCTGSRGSCIAAWKQSNYAAWDRWREARREYFAARHQIKLAQHRGVKDNAWKRHRFAVHQVNKHKKRLAKLRREAKHAVRKCHKKTAKVVAKFHAHVTELRTHHTNVANQIAGVRTARAAREQTYQPFFMTRCRHIGEAGHHSGRQHAFNCELDVNNKQTATHKYSNCVPRGPAPTGNVRWLKFRCYK